ncbi:pyruvate ferredoxin oxidoreductase [Candidatus Parcubacteria bacterium]|nr:pyruvate ferredoxin oxidoreductase [Candidatus Parcubacteria bacterium]
MSNKTTAKSLYSRQTKKPKSLLSPGHRACAGCGQIIAARAVAEALGPNTIIANATGCLEVTTTPYPESAWGMPWIHSLFENPAAIASGILAALKQQGKDKKVKVVAQGGDGSTFDIGFGLISGMWERGENILYVCYDNEAYANTGIQASGATPWAANTTTSPTGSSSFGYEQRKKDMIAIALAHRVPYAAQTTAGFLADIKAKIKKAIAIKGPAYIQILVPCVPGWKIKPEQTIKLGRLAAQTGCYPAIEYTNGQLTNAMKAPQPRPKADEYLSMQGRFKHLLKTEQGKKQIEFIQQIADENVEKYGL